MRTYHENRRVAAEVVRLRRIQNPTKKKTRIVIQLVEKIFTLDNISIILLFAHGVYSPYNI